MNTFKKICKKIAAVLSVIIGYAVAVCLFAGGLGVVGYIVALIAGGETAAEICTWLSETYYTFLIKVATWTTVAAMLMFYLNGDAAWKNPFRRKKDKAEDKAK